MFVYVHDPPMTGIKKELYKIRLFDLHLVLPRLVLL